LALKICLPLAASPIVVLVVVVVDEVLVVAAVLGSAAGEACVVVVVVDVVDWSLPPLLLEHPAAITSAMAPAARNANGFDCMDILSRHRKQYPRIARLSPGTRAT
jgi:hypothetical protein